MNCASTAAAVAAQVLAESQSVGGQASRIVHDSFTIGAILST